MHSPHSFNEIYTLLKLRKVPFFMVFFVVVLFSYSVLYAIDFIPEPVTSVSSEEELEEIEEELAEEIEFEPVIVEPAAEVSPVPLKIIFDSLDKEVVVLNPTQRDVASLDAALLKGVVRHPDSADFTEDGNIFILGHSSYLPNVLNKNFQAFNGIQKLTWGDTIRLQSADTEYVYRVQKVYQAKASDVSVPFTPGIAQLTLATCNSFGSKDDRFMVEATLIETNKL